MATSVVLITGALTGIGRATALASAREGARVVVSGRNTEDGHALAAEIQDLGLEAVNLSSTLAQRTAPGTSVYAASKHAVEGLTKAAALEAAPYGVRVNAIAPGPVATGMLTRLTASAERKNVLTAGVPLKRLGHPKEIADVIVFIASGQASFVTGQIIGVDGGKMA